VSAETVDETGDGAGRLTIEKRDIASLRPHPRNYRRHPEHQLAILRESLRVHGQQKPVVITPDGTILAGHGLVQAAGLEGWEQIACHVYDGPYPEAFLAIDNRASDLAEDDEAALAELLRALDAGGQLDAAGWGEEDLGELLLRLDAEEKRGKEETFDIGQAVTEAEEQEGFTRVQPGELWQLGRHRVLCGDSTDPEQVARLMAGMEAGLLATDPPYGVAYDGNQHRRTVSPTQHGGGIVYGAIANDDLVGSELEAFLTGAFEAAAEHLTPNAAWYVWHASRTRPQFLAALAAVGVEAHQEIVWIKEGFQFGRADYHWQHEPCLYGWREGHVFLGPRNQSTVWEIPRQTDHEHPTTKPVRLWEIPAENHLSLGGIMLDPFLGSGTAVIAAERTGRTAYGLELEPRYCDVILARWECFTGDRGEKIDG
jgi:site-specific DNA-methyltransferase (adenine-specific)